MVEIQFPDFMAGRPPAAGATSRPGGRVTIVGTPELHARGLTGAPEVGIAMATFGLVALTAVRPLASGLHTASIPREPWFSANAPKTGNEALRAPARRASAAATTART